MQDRPYQGRAHTAIRKAVLEGTHNQLIQMATGTGKTVVFSQLPEKLGDVLPGKMLVLAHREELIDQAIAKIRQVNPHLRIEKEMANNYASPSLADVVVASVSTLGRKGNARLKRYDWTQFDKFVTDEAHHATASTYANIYEAAGLAERTTPYLHLGVTATPNRADGAALRSVYDRITFTYGMREAIEDGWLCEPRGYRIRTQTSLDGVKVTAGDYNLGQLADTVNTPARNLLIVRQWMKLSQDRQTVAFTVDIEHARDLAAAFESEGVSAQALWGDDPLRQEKLQAHKAGEIKVLCNCGVLTEGYDDPNLGCIILARPTKSGVLFTQMVGRGTRLQEGCGNLIEEHKKWDKLCREYEEFGYRRTGFPWKEDCIILDVVDSSSRSSLVTLPTLMGMSANLNLKGKGIVYAAKKLEEAQKEHPHIDFSQVEDLSNLQAYVEEVNLFDVKFPPEVEEHSELSWHHSPTGGYVLLLPQKERVSICHNLLDKWEIAASIKGIQYRGERDTLEDAFAAADSLIAEKCADTLRVLRRKEGWHDAPATDAQMNLLRKLYRGRPLPPDLDKGKASRLIAAALARKR